MRSGVDNTVSLVIVRQIIALLTGVKSKLQHLHTRIAGLFYHFDHALGKISQVFCDDIHIAELFFDGVEQIHARSFFPVAALCRLITERDGIIFIKSAEMVDADSIVQFKHVSQT